MDGARFVSHSRGGQTRTRWRWKSDPIGANFGDPTTSSDYRLCIETGAGSYADDAPRGSGWHATGAGFRYRAGNGVVRSVSLRETAHQTSITVTLGPGPVPLLPMTLPLRLRFLRTGAAPACFEALFDAAVNNGPRRFLAIR